MSELNNNNDINKNEESINKNTKKAKKPFKIKVWVLILLYTIIALIVTGALIFIENSSSNENNVFISTPLGPQILNDDNIIPLKLSDKYAINNITIKDVEEEIGEVYATHDFGDGPYTVKRISVQYSQIDGLKDSDIENKINKFILDKINSLKETVIIDEHDGKIDINVCIYHPGYGNFITIETSANAYEKDVYGVGMYSTEMIFSEYEAEYIRLDNAREVTFREIFTKDADLNYIIAQSAYDSIIGSHKYVQSDDYEYEFDLDMDKIDYAKIENDVIRIVNYFKRNMNSIMFHLSERYIYFTVNDEQYLTIDMMKHIDSIAIYSRFMTNESLFENGDLPKKTYVFRHAYEYEDGQDYSYKELGNNMLVRIDTYSEAGYELIVEERENKVKNYLIRESDTSQVYIYNIYLSCSENWENSSGNVLIMNRSFFEDNKDNILRYLSPADEFEEPQYDTSKIEEKYFNITFDENNNVLSFEYESIDEENIESGSEEVIDDETSDQQYQNFISDYNNTITDDVQNTTTSNNTVENVVDSDDVNENNVTNTVENTNTVEDIVDSDIVVDEENDEEEEDLDNNFNTVNVVETI